MSSLYQSWNCLDYVMVVNNDLIHELVFDSEAPLYPFTRYFKWIDHRHNTLHMLIQHQSG